MIIDCPNLEGSIDFYKKLGYTIKDIDGNMYASDGKAIIRLNPKSDARLGIIHFTKKAEEFSKLIAPIVKVDSKDGSFTFIDPSGVRITLSSESLPDKLESGINSALTGNFAGISIESIDIEKSVKIWELLDFEISMGGIEQGWIVMTDPHGSSLSILKYGSSPHLFFNPSLSYFNGKENLEVIEKVRATGLGITQEITTFNEKKVVDNILIRDPGGLGFFLFSD